MSVPTWLNQATPNLNRENASQNRAAASSIAFSRPSSMASFNPSQSQYQQIQLRVHNGSMHHGPPSSQSPTYNTQNVVPLKRSRPRDGSISALPPSYPGGVPISHLQTREGRFQEFPGAVHGGPPYRGPAIFHQFQQHNNNPSHPPILGHPSFNPRNSGPAVHRLPPRFSPFIQKTGTQNANLQPGPTHRIGTAQRSGLFFPPYGAKRTRPPQTKTLVNSSLIPQNTNPPKLSSQQQRSYVATRAKQMEKAQLPTKSRNTNDPYHLIHPSRKFLSRPNKSSQIRRTDERRGQIRANMIQRRSRASHLGWLLRSMVQYMHSRRLPFNPRPMIASKSVSCVIIFLLGMRFGGSRRMQRFSLWSRIAQLLSIPHPRILEAGRDIHLYWDKNLVEWERYFTQFQQSKPPSRQYRNRQRLRFTRNNSKMTHNLLNDDTTARQASILQIKRPQAPQERRLSRRPGQFENSKKGKSDLQHASQQDFDHRFSMQFNNHAPNNLSKLHGSLILAKQEGLPSNRRAQSIASPSTKFQDAVQKIRLPGNATTKIISKKAFLKSIEEGFFRIRKSNVIVPKTKTRATNLRDEKTRNSFVKMVADSAVGKSKVKTIPRKSKVQNRFSRTQGTAKGVLLKMVSQDLFPRTTTRDVFPKLMMKDVFPTDMARDTVSRIARKDVVPTKNTNNTSKKATAKPIIPELKLLSPSPVMSYYTPKVYALDSSVYTTSDNRGLGRKSPSSSPTFVPKTEDKIPEPKRRTQYHGGLPIHCWLNYTLDVTVKYKHSTPQLKELGVVDIQVLILSLKSGIHGEVRLALDTLAALSHESPPLLRGCGELLDTLIDFANDQIEVLGRASPKTSDFAHFPSQQKQIRKFKQQGLMLQEVPDLGSCCYDLSRAASRLVSVTTILRNLSLLPDNRKSLGEPSIIRTMTTIVRCLGTRNLFLRTHENALDFSEDMVTFLSALSPDINLTSKEDGLAILHFLLSFAPEPRPKISGGKISFASYVPTVHRNLPHAVNTLAKLIAGDPNRAVFQGIFASESASSPSFDLLTRAFGLAVSIIPEAAVHPGGSKNIIAVRGPIIAQGLLSAEILVGMLPMSAHDVAYSWLSSQDSFVSRLMALLSLMSKIPATELQRGPGTRPGTINDLFLEHRMINIRGGAFLTKLAERAQDTAAFASDFSPDVSRLKQSISQASRLNKEL